MSPILAVAIGGAFGSVCRFIVGQALSSFERFPLGTLSVNILGCFLIGVAHVALPVAGLNPTARAAIMIGFLGGFTTFSSFGLDAFRLLEDGRYMNAATYLLASNLVGLAAVCFGIWGARMVLEAH